MEHGSREEERKVSSNTQSVCDIAACCLRGAHNAHHLAAGHAVVPRNGVVELNAGQLCVLHLQNRRATEWAWPSWCMVGGGGGRQHEWGSSCSKSWWQVGKRAGQHNSRQQGKPGCNIMTGLSNGFNNGMHTHSNTHSTAAMLLFQPQQHMMQWQQHTPEGLPCICPIVSAFPPVSGCGAAELACAW